MTKIGNILKYDLQGIKCSKGSSCKIMLLIILLQYSVASFTQVFIPLDRISNLKTEQAIYVQRGSLSTFLKPFDFERYENYFISNDSLRHSKQHSWLIRKLFFEPYLTIDSQDFKLIANPLFDFSYGSISDNTLPYYNNIRGAIIGGHLSRKLFFESWVAECQSRWPLYITDYVHSSNVSPGMGQARRFGNDGFDYAIAQGNIAFPVGRRLKSFLGTGKFFAGDGYRSLLLSDVGFNYPYLLVQYHYGNWYLSHIYATTMSDTLPKTDYGLREKRLNSFGIISFIPNPRIELSLFEGYVFRYPNSKKRVGFNSLFLNPFPLLNLTSNDSAYSSIVGMNIRLNILKTLIFYQQVALSNLHYLSLNKENIGIQTGIKWYNAFSIRNLFLLGEWNFAGTKAYTSYDSLLAYSHFNQPLAHIQGNNFDEKIAFMSYSIGRLSSTVHGVWTSYGQKNMGLLKSKSRFVKKIYYATPFIGEGAYTSTQYVAFSLSYKINPKAHQNIEIGYISRQSTVATLKLHSEIFYLSFKVNWFNTYFDF
ncbi:MAG: hypothetical protein N2662_12315 [Bacteroidales bacterium]|nr:hypothetical protein [Bacteroidales bacterium]